MDERYRAIPQGYMTVGELAKKMDVTVRTLQYYDKRGILSPTAESEGGRRLYTDKDIVKLHQIQSMKYLGFTLEDIKYRVPSINTPEEVSVVLLNQIKGIKEEIATLTDVLEAFEKFKKEVASMEIVDWAAYADILVLLQSKSELYWARKHFSDKAAAHIGHMNEKNIKILMQKQNHLLEEAEKLHKSGVMPNSVQGQEFAKNFWHVVMQLMGNDTSLLTEFTEVASKYGDSKWKSKQDFIEKALDFYLENQRSTFHEEEV